MLIYRRVVSASFLHHFPWNFPQFLDRQLIHPWLDAGWTQARCTPGYATAKCAEAQGTLVAEHINIWGTYYICMGVYIYNVCTYIYIYMYVCMHTYIYIYIHICWYMYLKWYISNIYMWNDGLAKPLKIWCPGISTGEVYGFHQVGTSTASTHQYFLRVGMQFE